MPDPTRKAVARLLLLLITLLAAGLRVRNVNESLWVDELHTAWTVADGFGQIAPRAAIGNYSPAYFYLPWVSSSLFGATEWTLRLPSLLAGVMLVPVAYGLVASWTRERSSGLFVALLVSMDPNFVFYAQEARSFAWVQLVGLVQVWLFWNLLGGHTNETPPHRRLACRIAWIVCSAVLFYFHYTTALLLVAEIIGYALIAEDTPRAYRWWHFCIDLAVIGVLWLPARSHVIEIAARRDNWAMFVRPEPPAAMFTITSIGTYCYGSLLILVALATAARVFRRPSPFKSFDIPGLPIAACWAAVPVGVAWLTTHLGWAHLFHLRYVIVAGTAPMIFASLCLSACRGWRVKTAFGTASLAMALCVSPGLPRPDGMRNEDWQGAVRCVNECDEGSGLPVFVMSGLIECNEMGRQECPLLDEYCLLPVTSIYRVDTSGRRLIALSATWSNWLGAAEVQAIRERGGAFFLLRIPNADVPHLLPHVRSKLRRQGMSVKTARLRHFGNVTLVQIVVDNHQA